MESEARPLDPRLGRRCVEACWWACSGSAYSDRIVLDDLGFLPGRSAMDPQTRASHSPNDWRLNR